MSIIYSYPEQSILNPGDMLIGTSVEKVGGKQKNVTKNFTIQQVADFINSGVGLIDPVASDFQIPVFNQGGLKITGSIMSQDAFPNGTGITIAGNLTVNGGATIGDQVSNVVFDSPTKLLGPILDSGSVQGGVNQILISNQLGKVNWIDYEAGLTYEGTWDAAANTTNGQSNSPALVQGVGVSGHFYIVDVEGTTSLGPGLNDWHVGDWAVFLDQGGQPASWQKIDNTSVLTGDGTAGVFAKWTDTTTLNDSLMSQSGTNILINGGLKVKDTVEATTTNSNLKLKGNGTGGVEVRGDSTSLTDAKITLNCYQNTHGVTIQSPAHAANATYTLILPTTTGNAADVLTSSGPSNSQLVWTTPTTGTVTGTGTENYVTKWSTGGTGIQDSTIFDNGTKVGIGTTSPNVRTEIAASVNGNPVTAGSVQTNGALRVRGSATNVLDIGQQSVAPYGMWMQVGESTNLGVNYPLVINPNGGNVGIGEGVPGAKLHVLDNSSNNVLAKIRVQGGASSGYAEFGSQSGYARIFSNGIQTYTANSGASFFYTGGSVSATLNSTGMGIGTSPSKKLHVSSGDQSTARIRLSNTNAGGNDIDLVAGINNVGQDGLSIYNATSNQTQLVVQSGGNVGIGTTNPGAKLEVAGNVLINSGEYLSWGTTGAASIEGSTASNKLQFRTDSADRMIINNTGVGIGTTSPAVSLDISATDAVQMPVGTTLNRPSGVDGMLRYNSSNNGFEGYINGNWGDIGGGTSGGLIFRGTFDASTGAIAGGGNLTTGATRVAVAIGDMYIVSTAGDFYGDTSVPLNVGDEVICVLDAAVGTSDINDWNAIASGAGGAVTGSGTTNYVPKFTGATVVGNSSIFNDASGNVGIGTASPSAPLEVLDISFNGPGLKVSASSLANQAELNLNRVAANRAARITYALNGTNQWFTGINRLSGATTNDYSISTTDDIGATAPSFLITSAGNVGIGTSSPSKTLEIKSTGNTAVRISTDGDAGDQPEIQFYRNSMDYAVVKHKPGGGISSGLILTNYRSADSNIIFNTAGENERMRIDSSGNVGIGTTSPESLLHLFDSTQTNQTITFGDPSAVGPRGSINYNSSGFENLTISCKGTTTNYGNISFETGPTPAERLRITSSGQIQFNNYTTATSFTGTAVASLAVDSSGNIITEAAGGGGGASTITTDIFSGNGTVGPFPLGATPSGGSTSFVDVFIDGVYQEISTYTVSGTALSFVTGSEPPTGTNIQTKTTSGAVSGALVSSVDIGQSSGNTGAVNLRIVPLEVTSGQTIPGNANYLYIFTATAGGSIATVTLPGSPTLGDSIKISNLGGLANVLGANGNKIMGQAADMTINTPTAAFEIIWSGSNNGWIIIGNV